METKNIITFVLMLSTLILIGCENEIKHGKTIAKNNENTVNTTENRLIDKGIKKSSEPKIKSIPSSGDKLIFESDVLKKGDVVFNQTMGQKGVVTGTIVITLSSDFIPDDLNKSFTLTKMTSHNYKLLVNKTDNIQKLVSMINNFDAVSNIEILVDYSPIDTQF